ncbi:MAG: HlyD family efflux transporter periplasmic adaptor subunit [Sterolibacteriaceae bacterium]|uniref:HlyD family efflux transporter periplasmic adaptor subunit n=1 Tax=Candidatus Methylophosphatis roskildensis TaxID=2899263 RepID=A0A9D7HNR2_9PROT|nr:HlyD family efflux transporter periplasmic adaptor subunit [Candidatus Methylophosphatis roskildensis]
MLAERQTKWLGTVLVTPRLSHRLFTVFAALAAAAILGLLFFADYTRKARIAGWLVPQQGLMRVHSPQAGVVTQIYVKEGAEVHTGDSLVVLSAELQSASRGATQAEIARQLAAQRDSLADERRQHERLLAQQARALSERLGTLQSEQLQLKSEISLQKSRVGLAEKSERRQIELRERGFISDQQLLRAEDTKLEQASRLHALERDRIVTLRDSLRLESELRDLPLKARAQIANIERNTAQVEQALAEAESRREIVIPAPQDGTVTAIQAERGGRANPNVPLLSIVPAGSHLEGHMFGPSRAIGFVRPGQRVLVRYQAYPYQKFGHYEGFVDNISRSAVSPGELPPQLAGLTSLYGTNEPVYRITVSLASQTVTAYGKPVPLQPGMQLEADVVIETRKLIEWVLDPLFTITGKWHG